MRAAAAEVNPGRETAPLGGQKDARVLAGKRAEEEVVVAVDCKKRELSPLPVKRGPTEGVVGAASFSLVCLDGSLGEAVVSIVEGWREPVVVEDIEREPKKLSLTLKK
ncbi:hypothetical protein GOP47_0002461 [Adiantum capillus-veneris]|uniref:Uncharacterized protein n=1 Tax=Adiantum capillus-veneris TaxID=13818 RepID=A0A9D4ZP47_ADICA|nr:hypothetical protein GOP47_0002461 [Adiantum capillus-veneris]